MQIWGVDLMVDVSAFSSVVLRTGCHFTGHSELGKLLRLLPGLLVSAGTFSPHLGLSTFGKPTS